MAVGDEHSMQGMFNQHIEHAMSEIFDSQDMDIVFGDFKCTTEDYGKVKAPVIACFDTVELARIIEELVTWWAEAVANFSHRGSQSSTSPRKPRSKSILHEFAPASSRY